MQAKQIPFLVFDVGGVEEMIEESINTDSIILQLTTDALLRRMKGISNCLASFLPKQLDDSLSIFAGHHHSSRSLNISNDTSICTKDR